MNRNLKLVIFAIIGICIFILICILPFLLVDEEEQIREYLPDYQNIKIDESNSGKQTTRKDLENNQYFKRFALSPEYNYVNVSKGQIADGYLGNMIRNFIYNFELYNKEAIYSKSDEEEKFCMNVPKVKEAFEELYYLQNGFNDFMDFVPGYIEYVSKDSGRYCFNYGKIANVSDGETYIGIDSLSVSNKNNITVTLYLYEFYTMYTQKENNYINILKSYINNSKYTDAKKLVEENLNGTVTHKKMVFRINNKPKYFPFKLLYSFNID